MLRIKAFLLSLTERLQFVVIVGTTMASGFLVAIGTGALFDSKHLMANLELSTSLYEVLGTIYAVLLAFAVSGVWQNFSAAVASVQTEADALLDLVHVVMAFSAVQNDEVRATVLAYARTVIDREWPALKKVARGDVLPHELGHDATVALIRAVQSLAPSNEREIVVFEQTLVLLNNWLNARRKRWQSARGGSAMALWPLLIAGATVLFAFHGLFVAKAPEVWVFLLLGLSFIVGLAFYLIFSLDSPFTGRLSADAEPFWWMIKSFPQDTPCSNGSPGVRDELRTGNPGV